MNLESNHLEWRKVRGGGFMGYPSVVLNTVQFYENSLIGLSPETKAHVSQLNSCNPEFE